MKVDLHAKSGDPSTSHAAMAAFDEQVMAAAARHVVALYEAFGPMPDFQLKPLFDGTWDPPHSEHLYRQARRVAADNGRIVDTGTTVLNPESKRQQIVWQAATVHAPLIMLCPCCGHVLRRRAQQERVKAFMEQHP